MSARNTTELYTKMVKMPFSCYVNNYKWIGNSLVVQWLGLCTFTTEGLGSIPGLELGSQQVAQCGQKKKKKNRKKISGSYEQLYTPQIFKFRGNGQIPRKTPFTKIDTRRNRQHNS